MRSARAQDAPAQMPAVTLTKVVGAVTAGQTPNCANAGAYLQITTNTVVFYCYKLQNNGPDAVTTGSLVDSYYSAGQQEVPAVPLGQVIPAGGSLTTVVLIPNSGNQPAYTAQSITAAAIWTVGANGAAYQIESQQTTIEVVQPAVQASLGVQTALTTSPARTCTTSPSTSLTALNYSAYYCLTITNASSVTLTKHTVSIPALGLVNQQFTHPIGPNQSLQITYGTNLAGATFPALVQNYPPPAPSNTSQAFVTSSTGFGIPATAQSNVATLTGPSPQIAVFVYATTQNGSVCPPNSGTFQMKLGNGVYFCVVIQNTGAYALTDYLLIVSATQGSGRFSTYLGPGQSLQLTANTLPQYGIPSRVLGPITPTLGIANTVFVTSSNPSINASTSAQGGITINIVYPTPRPTATPRDTETPFPTDTPLPTATFPPIPPTWTATATWTPSPTPTETPTVIVISTPTRGATPAGLPGAATPIPPTAALSPAEAAATATYAVIYGFVTPAAQPFVSPLNPAEAAAAATATYAVIAGLVTPAANPLVSPLNPADAGATTAAMTALAQQGTAAAATALAQQGTAQGPQPGAQITPQPTPQAPPIPAAGASGVPAIQPTGGAAVALLPTQPGATPPPASSAGAASSSYAGLFLQILDTASGALMVLWILAGSLLFFLVAGILVGLSVRRRSQDRFALNTPTQDADFMLEPPPPAPPVAAPDDDDIDWPSSLP